MRLLLFFDLPSTTDGEKREYRNFRQFLIKSGFILMQESVYTKLAPNQPVLNSVMDHVRKNKPKSGLVQMIAVTEKQFNGMEIVVGEYETDILNDERRHVIL